MLRHLFIFEFLIASFGNIAQPKISILPEKPYLTNERNLQFLEFDFIVEGQKNGTYHLDRMELLLFNKEGKIEQRQKLADEGMVSNFNSFPTTKVKSDKKISLFNPFYFFSNDVDLYRLVYQITFLRGKKKYTINKEIFPRQYDQKTKLVLPLRGNIMVDSGFDHYAHHRRLNTTHWGMRLLKINQNITRYAIDLALCDEDGIIYDGLGDRLERYYGFGQAVFAPAPGKVLEIVKDLRDNEIDGKLAYGFFQFIKNPKLASGNYVVIDHLNGEISLLAHLMQASIQVEVGQVIEAGDQVGRIGNSGDSTYPHLHYQLENEHSLNTQTFPAQFWQLDSVNGSKVTKPVFCNTGDLIKN